MAKTVPAFVRQEGLRLQNDGHTQVMKSVILLVAVTRMQFDQLKRREFIALLGGAVAWLLAAPAQQPAIPVIGLLMMYAESDARGQSFAAAFRDGLNALGWTADRNVKLEYRWATSEPERIERSAKELVTSQPALILSSSAVTTATLLKQTRTIPIFGNLADPVGSGFVESLSRPGGNVTGFINVEPAMTGKWLELLKTVAPRVTRVAAVFNPDAAPYIGSYLEVLKSVAASFAAEPTAAPVRNPSELETAKRPISSVRSQSKAVFSPMQMTS
jgi:putative ABC transport system substrate-binding protein